MATVRLLGSLRNLKNLREMGMKPKDFKRTLEIDRASIDEEKRTVELSFSSEEPLQDSWYGPPTVLLHEKGSVDLKHLRQLGSILVNHDANQVVGAPQDVRVDLEDRKGRLTARFGTDEESDRWFSKVKENILRGVSVSYRATKAQEVSEGATWKSGEKREFTGPLLVATRWAPREVSLTPIPADSSVGVGRDEQEDTMPLSKKVRERLETLGLPEGASEDEALEFIGTLQTPQEEGRSGDTDDTGESSTREDDGNAVEDSLELPDPGEAERAAISKERKRVVGLARIARLQKDPKRYSAWVRNGTSVDEARNEVLEHLAATQTPVCEPGDVEVGEEERTKFDRHHEHLVLMRCASLVPGLRKTLEKGKAPEGFDLPRDIPFAEILRKYALRAGLPQARGMTRDQLASAYFGNRAFQMGTSDFTNLLENVANKSLAAGFTEARVTYRQWTTPGTLPDFKQASRAKLSEAKQFVEVLELMPIEESTITDAKETYQLKTYGTRVGISRQAIVNDDLSGFSRIPGLFGAAAARTVETLVFAVLTTNGTMNEDSKALFANDHTSGDNLHAGALAQATLTTGRALMRKQTGLNGEKIDVAPRFLIIPVDLEDTAYNITLGQFVPTASTSARPPWIASLEVVATPILSDTSTVAWYLAADPAEIDTIMVAGLNTSSPTPTLTRIEGTDILGVQWIAYFDVAVAAVEHRGLLYSTGS
jgi:hypothetical protein